MTKTVQKDATKKSKKNYKIDQKTKEKGSIFRFSIWLATKLTCE